MLCNMMRCLSSFFPFGRRLLAVLIGLWFQPIHGVSAAETSSVPPGSLCVMTYNLRFDNPKENPRDAWTQRRPLMRELIRQLAPDVMGTQEGLYSQLKDLAADLPELDWIGLGREGGSKG